MRRITLRALVAVATCAVITSWFVNTLPQEESPMHAVRAPAAQTPHPQATPEPSRASVELRDPRANADPKAGFPYQRGQWFQTLRSRIDGTLPTGAMAIARQQRAALVLSAGSVAGAGIDSMSWEWLGPGNVGGRTRSIVIHPVRTDEILLGSVSGGIWKTTDAGASWRPVDDFLETLSIVSMAIDPNNPQIVYAGSGELTPGWYSPTLGAGVFKSMDFGDSWTQLANTASWQYVNRLAVNPADSNEILAANDRGIVRSTNGGTDWGLPELRTIVCDLSFHPGGTGEAVAGGCGSGTMFYYDPSDMPARWQQAMLVGNAAATTLPTGFVPDTDTNPDSINVASTAGFAGGDAVTIGSGFSSAVAIVASVSGANTLTLRSDLARTYFAGDPVVSRPRGRVEMAYARSNPSIVYAVLGTGNGSLWKSTDGGRNFNPAGVAGHHWGQGQYDTAVWVDPTNANRLVLGGGALVRTLDGGASFREIGWGSHADRHIIIEHPNFDAVANKTVFQGCDGGIFRTDDVLRVLPTTACATNADCPTGQVCDNRGNVCTFPDFGWRELNNQLGVTQFIHAAVDPATGILLGGTQDNGTPHFVPSACNSNGTCEAGEDCMSCPIDCPGTDCDPAGGPEGWSTVFGGDGGYCAIDPTDPTVFYGEYVRARVFRSGRGYIHGQTVTGGNGPCPSILAGDHIDACCSSALFYSPLIMDLGNPNRLLSGAARLWRTNNAKAASPTWEVIKGPAPTVAARNFISAIDIAPSDSNTIWVGHMNGQVFMTTNGTAANPTTPPCAPCLICPPYPTGSLCPNCPTGPMWRRVDLALPFGLPRGYVTRIRIDPSDANRVYLTYGGFLALSVWKTEDGGRRWESIMGTPPARLPNEQFNTIQIHPQQPGWLYVGTDQGLYTSQDDGDTWSAVNDGPANVIVNDLIWKNNELLAVTHGRGIFKTGIIIPDCDGNGVADFLELAGNDCNGNSRLDRCEPDCNGNGEPDDCDLASGVANFVRSVTLTVEDDPSSIAAADFNDDGFADLVVANINGSSFGPSVSVLMNLGDGPTGDWLGFDSAVNYRTPSCAGCPLGAIPGSPWAVTVSDVDTDGDFDIVYVFESGDLFRLTSDLDVLLNNGDGTFVRASFGPMIRDVASLRALAIEAGDLNGDPFDDLVIANSAAAGGTGQAQLTIVMNQGLRDDGSWLGFIPPRGADRFPDVGRRPTSIALGRFNVDGARDIASANRDSGDISILINDGTGVFLPETRIAIGGAPTSVTAADLNGDGLDDLAVAAGLANIFVLMNNGDGTFVAPFPYASGLASASAIASADFDRDGSMDLVFGTRLILNDGSGLFGAPFTAVAGSAISLATMDVDADGDEDFAGAPGTSRFVWVALNDSTVDCNRNGLPDDCDLAAGRPDSDGDGLLDECEREGCDVDGDGDCDLADYRRMFDCWRGPDVPCGAAASAAALVMDLDGDFDFDLRDYALLQIRYSGDQACCSTHGPGCTDFQVQQCVCESMAACCSTAWTAECVEAVTILNCGSCVGGGNCGNGTCDAGETCANCDRDCGSCAGTCCSANDSIGCDRTWVQDCVCRSDSACCTEGWTDECAALASDTCAACCGDGVCGEGESCRTCAPDCTDCIVACGNQECQVGEDCENCPADCGECPIVCGDGVCNGDETCVACLDDCGACLGSCCLQNGSIGCEDATVQDCVCSFDPTCCKVGWSAQCAMEAQQCGSCTGDCCSSNPTPGCFDPTVTGCVCAIDPTCCTEKWGVGCADLASNSCSACCGNGVCEIDESCETCVPDCGACPVVCGDGVCDVEETCANCKDDCGECPVVCGDGACDAGETCASCKEDCAPCTGACCTINNTPGCSDPIVTECVCAIDPTCCTEKWGVRCADLASGSCSACCGNGVCGIGETCETCVPDCDDCPVVCGDGVCDAAETCAKCKEDCGACLGSCCIKNESIGCEDATVQDCVCSFDPACCTVGWSAQCAMEARQCGSCDGDCCSPNVTPGCFDLTVTDCVCVIDPLCCTEKWGVGCANLASDSCTACCGDGICGAGEACETCSQDCGTCPAVCGDGVCDAEETCASCTADCGACAGSCCLARGTPGCSDSAVQGCVCALDPVCCDVAWDSICVRISDECGACTGDCCSANGTPGCDGTDVEQCVCANDAFCCETTWDDVCAGEAVSFGCGTCSQPPTVTILVPAQDSDPASNDPAGLYDGRDVVLGLWYKDVTFEGVAIDPEDGTLSGAAMVWTTDRGDIQPGGVTILGTGTTITVRLYSNVCTGVFHEITLTATDSGGNVVTQTRRVFIWKVC